MKKLKIIRITTVPISIKILLKGQLKYMSQYYNVVAVSSDDQCYDDMLSYEHVKGFKIEMTRKITLAKDVLALIKLIRLFIKEKPSIVHTHTPKAGTLGMLAAYITRVPNRLHTVAGLPLLEAKGSKRLLLNFVEKLTCACATKVFPNSFELEKIIIKNGYTSPCKLKVIGNGSSNGIDTAYFSKAALASDDIILKGHLGIPVGEFLFCFVGRIVCAKGINELVNTFTRLQLVYPRIHLLLIGGFEKQLDPVLPEIENLIMNDKAIHFMDFQQDVRPYLAVSDVFVFPSYREGFPNVVMQAGAMGLPCIVTDINGCNEIVENGVNGLIIPVKDEESLYNSMKMLFENKEMRNQMASMSRKMIIERYDQQDLWKALLAEYRNLEA